VSPLDVLHAYVAAVVALGVSGFVAARQQTAYAAISVDPLAHPPIDWARVAIVVFVLVVTVTANVVANLRFPAVLERFPVIGATVLIALFVGAALRSPDWRLLPGAFKGGVFLLSLVVCASLMPVETLPAPTWQSAFGLGFVSAVFDNIPLTALALTQGGYDWGMLAYAVGFGGSMIWFGSSAGVALSNAHPEAKSVGRWLTHGWHVTLAYVLGFVALLAILGWHPHAPH
jgi:hypothetical protein